MGETVILYFSLICASLGPTYSAYFHATIPRRAALPTSARELEAACESIVFSRFNVYNCDDKITYYREICHSQDLVFPFFLHITPLADDILPSFSFLDLAENGTKPNLTGSKQTYTHCLSKTLLPKYEIARIRTGQWRRWEGTWPSDVNDYEATYSAIVPGNLLVRSHFDIYISGNILIYTRESCTPSDTEAAFFLHVYPSDKRSLPYWRSQYDFDNLDFSFSDHRKIFDDKCIAAVLLPTYDMDRVISG